jgi:hypothetical protein
MDVWHLAAAAGAVAVAAASFGKCTGGPPTGLASASSPLTGLADVPATQGPPLQNVVYQASRWLQLTPQAAPQPCSSCLHLTIK